MFSWTIPEWELHYESISLISIMLLSLLLVVIFPPAEWVIGTYDGGFYVSSGVNIARTGSIVIHDQLIEEMNRGGAFLSGEHDGYALINGFVLTNLENGEIYPLLYNMFPVWIAIFYSIFGIWGTVYVAPFFGALGILGVYMVTRLVSNWQVATISSIFLSLNFIQLFFSRTPYTEVMVQYFIFGGLFTYIIYKKLSNKEFALISAISFSITMFIRMDSYIILIPFFVYYLCLKIFNRMEKCDVIFVNTFLAVSIYAMIHALKFNLLYLDQNLGYVFNNFIPGISAKLILYLIIFTSSLFLIYVNFIVTNNALVDKFGQYISKNRHIFKHFLITFIIIFVSYAWLIRPHGVIYSPDTYNAFNIIRLSQFLTPFLLLCSIIGLIFLVNSVYESGRFYLIGLFLLFFVIFIIDVKHSPPLPWMMRRYLSVIIPSILIFAAYFIYRFIELLPKKMFIRYLVVIVIIFMVATNYLHADSILKEEKMWDGMINTTSSISEFVGDDIIVFGNTPTAQLLANPIKYVYGNNVIYIGCGLDVEGDRMVLNNLKSNFDSNLVYFGFAKDPVIVLKALSDDSEESFSGKKKIYIADVNIANITRISDEINIVEVIIFNVPFKVISSSYEEIPDEMYGFDSSIIIYEVQFNNSIIKE
ncbi:MAG: hypothetical protein E4G94_00360 [ANME-2 cluster archaeon]|nr:MAG: hypothetical protein E4G94_00360 [ANME-2 cluster archaeon]